MVVMTSLACPQCGGMLPRQARWRMVTCSYCNAVVTRNRELVLAASFHDAWARAQAALSPLGRVVALGAMRFEVLGTLGSGQLADVFLAQRVSPFPERVVLKLAHHGTPAGALTTELQTLRALQTINAPGAAYFSQRLPQPVMAGVTSEGQEALVLRHPTGFWGSLKAVKRHAPNGIDPRHAVWMWRRVLEVLGYLHENKWTHGDLAADHLLVHPRDHGVLMIGWRRGQCGADRAAMVRDLMQVAWTMRALLHAGEDRPTLSAPLPAPLADLLQQASEDADWCARQGAAGTDSALRTAARASFGPPRFIPFSPTPSR